MSTGSHAIAGLKGGSESAPAVDAVCRGQQVAERQHVELAPALQPQLEPILQDVCALQPGRTGVCLSVSSPSHSMRQAGAAQTQRSSTILFEHQHAALLRRHAQAPTERLRTLL